MLHFFISHFQHNWEIVLGDTLRASEQTKVAISVVMKSSHVAGSIYSQWQCLDESSSPLPSPSPPSFLLLCFVHRDSKHFLACSYGKSDIYKREHLLYALVLCTLHCVSIWCPWLKIWVADTAKLRYKKRDSFSGSQVICYPSFHHRCINKETSKRAFVNHCQNLLCRYSLSEANLKIWEWYLISEPN